MATGETTRESDQRRRISELEAELEALRTSEARLRLLSDATTETIAVISQGRILDVNTRVESMFGYAIDEAIGTDALLFVTPEYRSLVADNIRSGYDRPYEVLAQRRDGSSFSAQVRGRPVTFCGQPARVTMVLDITEYKALQAATAAAHEALLATLNTSVLPIAEGVLLMPIVGQVLAGRAEQTLSALLHGVSQHRAHAVIFDVTGVRAVDTAAADILFRAAAASRLLGARPIITGVSPALAQAVIGLGLDLSAVELRGTLQDGVRAALARA